MIKKITLSAFALALGLIGFCQIISTPAQQLMRTGEDSLTAGAAIQKTVISGYGSVAYRRDFNAGTSVINLERAVLFVGHRFNEKVSFFSELELENGKVTGESTNNGEIAMEQAYLRFNVDSRRYFVAGLFTPRIGILNENHLPVNFNGVERPIVESLVIPATWRELGIGYYGRTKNAPLEYSIAVMNGLNAAGFEEGSGIREGRFEGSEASANSLAFAASARYFCHDFIFQVSGYAGGSNTLSRADTDSLNVKSGPLALPVYLGEADLQYNKNAWSAKALGILVGVPKAEDINRLYANNTADRMYGAYAELGYDLLYKKQHGEKQLKLFSRYEVLNLNDRIPANAVYNGDLKQSHLLVGLGWFPLKNVVIKADLRLLHTGAPQINTGSDSRNDQFVNLGIGYSF